MSTYDTSSPSAFRYVVQYILDLPLLEVVQEVGPELAAAIVLAEAGAGNLVI